MTHTLIAKRIGYRTIQAQITGCLRRRGTSCARLDPEGPAFDARPPAGRRPSPNWPVRGQVAGDRPVLAFGSKGDTRTVVVDFDDDLWHLSNEDLQRLLDEGQGSP